MNIYDLYKTYLTKPKQPPTPSIYNGLCFTSVDVNGSKISLQYNNNDVKYSYDSLNWQHYSSSSVITLKQDEKVYFKGYNSQFFYPVQFTIIGLTEASGNVTSLIDNNDGSKVKALPNDQCFSNMFRDCLSLTTAPSLPATILTYGCYAHMFRNCTSLTVAPELPATTLADYCYSYMFFGCTQLNTIKLKYTDYFYVNIFYNWVDGVANNGIFYYNGSYTSSFGVSEIPTGWTVHTF